jgi:hypothetical protein
VTDSLTQALELILQAKVLIELEAETPESIDHESLFPALEGLRLASGALTAAIEERAVASEFVH